MNAMQGMTYQAETSRTPIARINPHDNGPGSPLHGCLNFHLVRPASCALIGGRDWLQWRNAGWDRIWVNRAAWSAWCCIGAIVARSVCIAWRYPRNRDGGLPIGLTGHGVRSWLDRAIIWAGARGVEVVHGQILPPAYFLSNYRGLRFALGCV